MCCQNMKQSKEFMLQLKAYLVNMGMLDEHVSIEQLEKKFDSLSKEDKKLIEECVKGAMNG